MTDIDQFFDETPPARSEFFNARYSGFCEYAQCYKHNTIEIGDGCEYYLGDLMHMRCARAAQRWDNEAAK
jgi:hypothetical protein